MLKSRTPSPAKVSSRSPSPAKVVPRRNPALTKAPRRNPSPVQVANVVATRRNPVRTKAAQRNPSPVQVANVVAAQRNPSPVQTANVVATRRNPYSIDLGKILPKGVTSANLAADIRRSPSPKNRAAQIRNYERSNVAYQPFIAELKGTLYNEKIIDRDSELFETLLADQQKWNHLFYNIRPRNLVCFIICDYHLYDKRALRVFHVGNKPREYFGNVKFNNLLRQNNMSMKWSDNNILYIHKNRF